METLVLPISEEDIENFKDLVYKGEIMASWEFRTKEGTLIKITFVKE